MSPELQHVRERVVYSVRSGSHMYGLNDENSDSDSLGVFVATPQLTLGHGSCRTVKNSESDETYKILQDYSLQLLNGSPFWVETLFASEDSIITRHSAFDCFLRHKNSFLTRSFLEKSLRFMDAMTKFEFGENTPNIHKKLSHALRTGYTVEHWLNTGDFNIRVINHRDELMSVKRGHFSVYEAHDKARQMYAHIDNQFQKCGLPEQIGIDFVNQMIAETTLAYWSHMGEI